LKIDRLLGEGRLDRPLGKQQIAQCELDRLSEMAVTLDCADSALMASETAVIIR
jgi:hypothetical protein